MAHELDERNGKVSMVYTGQVPWHGLGQYMGDNAIEWQKALAGSGLDWKVKLLKLYARPDTDEKIDGILPVLIPTKKFKAIVRTDVNEILGVVRERYQLLQNEEMFQILEPFLDECKAVWHTAGAIKEGRWVWVLAKLPNHLIIGREDVVDQYLLITNAHDGMQALRIRFTPIRVVCNNTLQMALLSAGETMKIAHLGNVKRRAEKSLETLGLIRQYTDRFKEVAELMLKQKMTQDMTDNYLRDVLGITEDVTNDELEMVYQGKLKTYNMMQDLVETGAGTKIKSVKGSLWGVYNAVTEYVDHHKGTTTHKLQDIWINGSGMKMKEKAWNKAKELING